MSILETMLLKIVVTFRVSVWREVDRARIDFSNSESLPLGGEVRQAYD